MNQKLNMKILINTPPATKPGGVANHFSGLKQYWSESVYYNYIGGRNGIPGFIILGIDLVKFIIKLITVRPDVVLLNPSLRKRAIKRDGYYLRLSKFFKVPTVIFFHGWDQSLADQISKKPEQFFNTYKHADKLIVLASDFKKQLREWGILKPVSLTTTKVDDKLISSLDISKKRYGKTILFLSRIEKPKGIFIALKAYQIVKQVIPDSNLIIAGNGSMLKSAREYVNNNRVNDVEFTGHIGGGKLVEVYKKSDYYILPTYSEGMPTSVLEAMAFGLPVLTRPVGGMVDFFENDKMGYLVDSLNPEDFANKIIEVLLNRERHQSIGHYNYEYAKQHFYASNVVSKLEAHLSDLNNENYH